MAPRLRGVKEKDQITERTVVSAASPLTSGPAASVRGLTRKFGDRTILAGLDLEIAQGEFIALIGRSGSGKSTLLRALAGLDQEVTGELSAPGPVSVAFQEPRLVPWKKVLANVALTVLLGVLSPALLRPAAPARPPGTAHDQVRRGASRSAGPVATLPQGAPRCTPARRIRATR